MRVTIACAWCVFLLSSGEAAERPPWIETAEQVRRLAPEDAASGYPVRFAGTVTFYDPVYHAVFLHDGATSIYVNLPKGVQAGPGDALAIEGESAAGKFSAIVRASSVRKTGQAGLPIPKPVSYERLATGMEDAQWVEVSGVVRSVVRAPKENMAGAAESLLLDLSMLGGRIRCVVSGVPSGEYDSLINTRVHIDGVCYSRFNQRRQLRAPWLAVNRIEDVHVEIAAPPEPPPLPIDRLSQFDSLAHQGQRVKVGGVVTARPGAGVLFIQQGAVGLEVKTVRGSPEVKAGDVVEVLGFPLLGQFKPLVLDAIHRRVRSGEEVPPLAISAGAATRGEHDAELVTIRARLLNRVQRGGEHQLILQEGSVLFNAEWTQAGAGDLLADIRPNSVLDVTGVCVAEREENWDATLKGQRVKFRLLLRSPGDIVTVARPPWWTTPRLLWLLAGITVVFAFALAWAVSLRRQVARQTRMIRRQVAQETVQEERNRLAREFHDTLEQELAAITLQLDAADAKFEEAPTTARQLLNVARAMTRRSCAEVRRSVWDLRSALLSHGDLALAVGELARQTKERSKIEVAVLTQGTPRALPARQEHHLLRIAQEAITNAVKHSGAKRIALELSFAAFATRLSIRDDGRGFAPQAAAGADGGHFGLIDMRERAARCGATFDLRSSPGSGTEIVVLLPGGAGNKS